MAKLTGKNAILLIGGYSLSTYGTSYEVKGPGYDTLDITGFTDGVTNYALGLATAEMSVSLMWDQATNTVTDALKTLGQSTGVTILPEGYSAAGAASLFMQSYNTNFTPAGSPSTVVQAGTIKFVQRDNVRGQGVMSGWALQHGTITNTLTGTDVDDPSGALVTATCAAMLHVWTPTTTDTYVVKVQHSTTAGSGYADLLTFTANGTARAVEVQSAASGTVNRYRRVLATRTGAGAQSFGFTVSFWHG